MHPELEHLLDPALLDRLTERPLDDVRRLRVQCQQLEDALSYQRRVVHARLDLVRAEQARRGAAGAPDPSAPTAIGDERAPDSDEELVARLADVLADRTRGPGLGQAPRDLRVPDLDGVLVAEVDAAVEPVRIAALGHASDAELAAAAARLEAFEADVSADRRALHQRLDALSAEITRRYRTGEASVDTLLG